MRTDLFDYNLPESFIAQQPAEPRDSSRLLVLHRATGQIEHKHFRDIGEFLDPGDLLVANNSRVIAARLQGQKPTGGKVEVFLLRQIDGPLIWECLVRGRNLNVGMTLLLNRLNAEDAPTEATINQVNESGTRQITFSNSPLGLGEVPLPPYIDQYVGDAERYQTIYSNPQGSAAAPTAGLHFTPELLATLHQRNIALEAVTLHVGLDTFKPINTELVDDHQIHSEWAELSATAAQRINQTTLAGSKIASVGTTSARVLEWAATSAQGIDPYHITACPWQRVSAFAGDVDIFIRPGYRFRAIDKLITNFHLPRSSLLMMVSSFVGQSHPTDLDAGRRILLEAYETAKSNDYRFFSFGDAMMIV